MFKLINLFLILALSLIACTEQNTSTQETDHQELSEKYQIIVEIVNSVACTNAEDWTYTAIGAKACGGPHGYIAYSLSGIDVANFLNLVSEYTTAEHEFNIKWGIMSDCSLEPVPTDVICDDGVAQLIY